MQSIIYPIIQKPIIQSNKGALTTWLTLMEDTNGDKKSEVSFAKQANWILVSDMYCGGFHLHLLVFPFIYQFNSRIVALVCSSFANN